MDSSTRLYRSYMRPFRDRPDLKVLGRWYWCPPGARALPFAHAFGSQYQDTFREEFLEYVIGEQVGWHGPNFHQPNPRYLGKHWCGTEQDWQEGSLYGAIVPRDWEGVPLCCNITPLRPGGGMVGGKAPAFTLTQAMWWLNPDTLSGLADGDPVTTWATSAGPPNDGFLTGPRATQKQGLAIPLFQDPPHGNRNVLAPTTGFTLSQCTWYLVGGGANTILTQNGPNILGGILTGGASFTDNRTALAAATNHHIASHTWLVNAAYGIFSVQFDLTGLRLFMDGMEMASSVVASNDRFSIAAFLIGNQSVSPFAGTGTSFSEFILFGRVLSFTENWEVLKYLATKYAIPLGPDPNYFAQAYFAPAFFPRFYFP